MAVVTIRQLLDSGVHFGHQTRRWNPKMKRFILTERAGSHIIDLQQSLGYIDKTYDYVRETVSRGGTILFVGTKKQAQGAIAEQAQRVGQPYVSERWLGGLLTNFQTISKSLARMKELEEIDFEDTTKGYTKKELLIKKRELDKLHKSLGGIRNLSRTPSALWVVDTKKEHLAVDEARKLGIPVIAILDTNCDPDEVQYPIPGNDDAIRSVTLLTRIVADAAAEGLIQRHQKPEADGEAAEPLAEWEAELLGASSDAPAATDAPAVAETPAEAEVTPAAAEAAEAVAAEAAEPAPAEGGEEPKEETPKAEAPKAKASATKAGAAEKAEPKKAPAKTAKSKADEGKATEDKATEKKTAASKSAAPKKTESKPKADDKADADSAEA
ncbi:MAG: 30S ribosomal protein S2 [Microbacteriaceae bacterium]|nr:30S ribosomal protein S2 [Microbacteriaceae bacterium]